MSGLSRIRQNRPAEPQPTGAARREARKRKPPERHARVAANRTHRLTSDSRHPGGLRQRRDANHQAGKNAGAVHRGWGSKKSAQAHLRNRLHKGECDAFRKSGCAVQNEAQNEVHNAVIANGKAMWGIAAKKPARLMSCCRTARLDASRAMKSKADWTPATRPPRASCMTASARERSTALRADRQI